MNALDRRRLLTSGAAAAVLAVSGLGASASPARGGVLRLGLSGADPRDRWHGAREFGTFMRLAGVGCAFETLTEIAPDGTLRGELATGWEPLDRGRSWIVTLRPGVRFHDGEPFGAADAVASLRRHLQRRSATAASGLLSGVVRIRKIETGRLRIDLSAADADLPLKLADPHLIMHPARAADRALARGTGTGLYRLDRFEAGSGFAASRVEDHWKADRAGWFDRILGKAIGSESLRIEALLRGDVDLIDLTPSVARSLAADARVAVFDGAGESACTVASRRLAQGASIGRWAPMDDGRAPQRWWFA